MSKNNGFILVVDDEKRICDAIEKALEGTDLPELRKAFNSTQAIEIFKLDIPRAVILDVNLSNSEIDGIGILAILKKHFPRLPTIVLTGHGNIHTAREAVKLGAFAFLEKPFYPDQLTLILSKALEFDKLSQENAIYKRQNPFLDKIIGKSKALTNITNSIEQAAKQQHKAFLILGCHGTGKKTFAKRIHTVRRPGSHFIILQVYPDSNSATLQEQLFQCPKKTSISLFDQAEKSSLYIENIELLPIEILQTIYTFLTTGMVNKQKYDINLILASTKSINELKTLSSQEKFYAPLLEILQVSTFSIPTLLERKDDIPIIVDYLCTEFFKLRNNFRKSASFDDDAMHLLSSLPWNTSNINELQTFTHWILNTYINKTLITADDISSKLNSSSSINMSSLLSNPILQKIFFTPTSMKEARTLFERVYVSINYINTGGKIKKTSDRIQMERSALHRKINNLNLQEYYKDKSLLHNDKFLYHILNIPIKNNDITKKKKTTVPKNKKPSTNIMNSSASPTAAF
ncbi:MAG: response regulator [Pseudomonadota bacterium]